MNADLAAMTPDTLLLEMRRAASKRNGRRARECLEAWMEKTGHTYESVSALVHERMRKAVNS